jgi:SAM-dependent methyltransferase
MEEVPYDEWADFIRNSVLSLKPDASSLLEFGIGTGNIALRLQNDFYILGFDKSFDMLKIAKNKLYTKKLWVFDMQKPLNLKIKTDAVICVYDSVNYIDTEEGFKIFVKNAFDSLKKGGVFIFDAITEQKIKLLFKNNVFTYNDRNFHFIWYNRYINRHVFINTLLFFVKQKNGLYEKIQEIHKRRIFELDFMKNALKEAGFETVGIYDCYKNKKMDAESQRLVFVAKKGEK